MPVGWGSGSCRNVRDYAMTVQRGETAQVSGDVGLDQG